MEYENLVDEILYELEKRLKINLNSLQMKKKLIVVGNFDKKSFIPLETIFDVKPFESEITDFDCVIVTSLSIEMMGHIALGCGGKNGESFLLKALLDGKNVYLLESSLYYKKYKKTAFKAIYHLYSEYECKLLQYGMKKIVDMTDILNENFKSYEVYENTQELKIDFTGKKLLQETEFIKNHIKELSCIYIDSNCIITPLAKEYIKNHHLTIKRI